MMSANVLDPDFIRYLVARALNGVLDLSLRSSDFFMFLASTVTPFKGFFSAP